MSKEKHPGGRPKKYDTPEEMQKAIDKYFNSTEKQTICGLAIALGFAQRKSLLNYEGYGDEFCNTIKRAKLKIEMYYEEHLVESSASGSIFALKNFKWKDKQEISHDVSDELKTVMGIISGGTKGKLPADDPNDSSNSS